jgi:hypothetical protein
LGRQRLPKISFFGRLAGGAQRAPGRQLAAQESILGGTAFLQTSLREATTYVFAQLTQKDELLV